MGNEPTFDSFEDRGLPAPGDDQDAGIRSVAIIVTALATLITVGALSARQVTTPTTAMTLLENGIASTTDVNRYVATELDSLRTFVRSTDDGVVSLPGYPIDVVLTRDEVLERNPEDLRDLVLERSAAVVYNEGLDAFDSTGDQSLGIASWERVFQVLVSQINEDNHRLAGWFAGAGVMLVALGSAGVVLQQPGYRRFRMLGLAVVVGALPGVVISGALYAVIGRIGSDPFAVEIRSTVRSGLEIPLRNFGIALAAGVAVTVAGFGLSGVESLAKRRLVGARGEPPSAGDEGLARSG